VTTDTPVLMKGSVCHSNVVDVVRREGYYADKKLQSDPVLIRPKLASVLIQS